MVGVVGRARRRRRGRGLPRPAPGVPAPGAAGRGVTGHHDGAPRLVAGMPRVSGACVRVDAEGH
ncbi:hypothetical protein NOCARDAX2BIS_890002 [Nocardioides sp. AX2bis]|nr:hypothetical protein NOCARDAX2BIS_890002 [Nocardioides sp. AX2bis]